ncbi:hypothetical protein KUTeg_018872 [Tegillarca granosa]|uniref:Acyl-coenzyme A thioesterase 8 n=1 Tax=Tegillarca granosa TaxID=220873 RepID=A0ABQ9EDI4_TEGGR|nr:hypothetical protein KUTeg_018872 [Tegillarca granosa]
MAAQTGDAHELESQLTPCNTVTDDQHVHSLHCYFLRPGNANKHILYHVDRTRDGNTYTSRAIKATQDSVPIFTMQASFKIDEVDPLQHQFKMPEVPPPESLIDEVSEFRKMMMSSWLDDKIHVEKRPVDPEVYHYNRPGEPRRLVWVKAIGLIGDNQKMHQCVAGFISDIALLGATRQPAPTDYKIGFMASLDHSIWFHTSFRADEWMLYDIQSPQCGGGKALVLGRIWRRDGVLAISGCTRRRYQIFKFQFITHT